MGYTPELSDYHSSTLRRVAWALGKPMTKTIDSLFDSLDRIVDPGKVCERCRDRSHCDSCYFKTRERINGNVPIDPILLARTEAATADNHGISMEAIMKVNQVSVLVSKKIGKNFCSWSHAFGVIEGNGLDGPAHAQRQREWEWPCSHRDRRGGRHPPQLTCPRAARLWGRPACLT